jgi:prolyl oligopeptidase
MTETSLFPDRQATEDEFLWLEEIFSDKALAWVEEQNDRTSQQIDSARREETGARVLEVLDSTERIPMVSRRGPFLYNFWQDAEHPRGLWRRTTPESYETADPQWDVLLDVDDLGRKDGQQWVFQGARMLFPDFRRALIELSPDGGDANVVREFDIERREFVEDGFTLPVAKTSLTWVDIDTVLVSTETGPDSLTTSSYPRQVRRWTRGQAIADAPIVHEVPVEHMGLFAQHEHSPGFERDILTDMIDFYTSKTWLLQGDELIEVDVPDDAYVQFNREWLLVRPRTDWAVAGTTYPAGSLLAVRVDEFMAGKRDLETLFAPDEHTSLEHWSWTRNHLLLTELRDVASRVEVLTPGPNGWSRQDLGTIEPLQTVQASGVDDDENDDYWLTVSGFLRPTTLQLGTVGGGEARTIKTAPSFFDAGEFTVEQHFATSKDGTTVPYFLVAPREYELDGDNPALLYGYGGFEISLTPGYNGATGRAWLERRAIHVVANIRGGGEHGPGWHRAALRENRHRAYEDFAAVAQDLIDRKATRPERLGCMGGSNGGLLVGNMLTHYPELFGAIVCQVPLLDMKRYTQLSAGASWIAEYGDPNMPGDWEFIQTFSPYHNLRDGVDYPAVLFYTATSDDRVGPVQARKMAARMQARGIDDVLFYENREGGHSGSADNAQRAHMTAMTYEFLADHLIGEGKA